MHEPNFLAGGSLDRAGHLRRDAAWLRERMADSQSRVLLLSEGRPAVLEGDEPALVWVRPGEVDLSIGQPEVVFLGLAAGVALFAIEAGEHQPEGSRYAEFRSVLPLLGHDEGALVAYARGVLGWHARHRFCSACGRPSEPAEGGHLRVCSDPGCAAQHYPRTDPAIITLITDADRCLLAHQRTWPAGRFSTLAGFVEPGESLEDALRREVREEVGIEVSTITYHSSQPWPFPSSLMVGFRATAASREIRVDGEEITEARWLTREEIDEAEASGVITLPFRASIARRLVEEWRERQRTLPLTK